MLCPSYAKSRSLAAAALALSLAACSSGPGGRQGPPGGGMGGPAPAGGASRLAGPVARPVSILLASFDTDHDMKVSKQEADAMIRAEWDKLSGSGPAISAIALSDWLVLALGSADAQPSTVAFDNNFDGVITRKEFETRLSAEFAQLDSSDDGMLSRAELVFDLPAMRGGDGRRPGRQGSGMQRGRELTAIE